MLRIKTLDINWHLRVKVTWASVAPSPVNFSKILDFWLQSKAVSRAIAGWTRQIRILIHWKVKKTSSILHMTKAIPKESVSQWETGLLPSQMPAKIRTYHPSCNHSKGSIVRRNLQLRLFHLALNRHLEVDRPITRAPSQGRARRNLVQRMDRKQMLAKRVPCSRSLRRTTSCFKKTLTMRQSPRLNFSLTWTHHTSLRQPTSTSSLCSTIPICKRPSTRSSK